MHPREELFATALRQHGAHREEIGRRHVHDARAGALDLVGAHPVGIGVDERPDGAACPRELHEIARVEVGRGDVGPIAEHADEAPVEEFGAGPHHDMGGIDDHAARFEEVVGDRATQLVEPGQGHRFEELGILGRKDAAHATNPGGRGKKLDAHAVGLGVEDGRGPIGRTRRIDAGRRARAHREDVVAAARPRLQVAFAHQKVESVFDRAHAHAHLTRHVALGRQTGVGGDGARSDVVAQAAVEVLVFGVAAALVHIVRAHEEPFNRPVIL